MTDVERRYLTIGEAINIIDSGKGGKKDVLCAARLILEKLRERDLYYMQVQVQKEEKELEIYRLLSSSLKH